MVLWRKQTLQRIVHDQYKTLLDNEKKFKKNYVGKIYKNISEEKKQKMSMKKNTEDKKKRKSPWKNT